MGENKLKRKPSSSDFLEPLLRKRHKEDTEMEETELDDTSLNDWITFMGNENKGTDDEEEEVLAFGTEALLVNQICFFY